MNIKIFSAEHSQKNNHSFQKIKKIKNNDFNGEIWIVGGFEEKTKEIKDLFDKTVNVFEENFFKGFKKNDFDSLEKFEENLKILNESISEEKEKINNKVLQNGGIIIAIFADDNLHFSLCGTPEIYFIRNGKFAKVSEGIFEKVKNKDLFINVASGDLRNNDKIILSTTRILRYATGNQIASNISGGVLEAAESMKFILPEEESCSVVLFHIKGFQTLPFKENQEQGKENVRKGFFANFSAGQKGPKFSLKLKNWYMQNFENQNPHKKIAALFLILLSLLLVASFVGMLSNRQNGKESEKYTQEIAQMKKDLISVETKRLEGKIDAANLLIVRIEKNAREITKEIGSSVILRNEIMQILQNARNLKDEVNKITRISGAKVLVDLKSIRENIDLKGIFEYEKEQFIFGKKELFKILSANGEIKNVSNLIIDSDDEIIDGSAFATKNELLFLSKNGRVIEFKNDEASFANTKDTAFKKAIALSTFSKYMYLLDPLENQIWKYEKQESGFTEALPYNLELDIENAVSFAIDGNIFVLTNKGEIKKIYRGKGYPYNIANIPPKELLGASKIYTNENLSKFYLLDNPHNRILVMSKEDEQTYYERQIVIEDVDEIRDFWVDAELNRLFFIDKTKLYEIGL